MKLLKTIFLVIALVLAMPMVTSCSEDEKEELVNTDPSIVGSWLWSYEGDDGFKLKEIYTFYPDGKCSSYFAVDESTVGGTFRDGTDYGTYFVNGNMVSITLYFYDEGYEESETVVLNYEKGNLVDMKWADTRAFHRQSYDVPSMPDIPQNPSNPDNPSAGKPNTPSNPDQPNTPTNPDEPNNPGLPSSPATNPLVGTWVYTQQNGTVEKQIFTNDYKYTFIHTELVSGEMRDYVDEFTYRIEGISSNQINIIITAIDGSYSDALTFYTDASYSYIKEVYNHPAGPEYGIIEDIYYKQ